MLQFFSKEKNLYWSFGLFVIFIGLIRYLAHSDFWSIYYSKYLFKPGHFQDSLYAKVVFHMTLFWIHWFPFGNIIHIIVVKFLYGLVGCGLLYYSYQVLRLKLNQSGAVLILCILCFNSIAFWDLPEPKADILCLFFLLAGTYYFLKNNRKIGLLYFVLALFSTPKVVLFLPLPILLFASQHVWSFKFTMPNFKQKLNFLRALIGLAMVIAFVKLDFSKMNSYSMVISYNQALRYAGDLLRVGVASGFYTIMNSYYPLKFVYFILPLGLLSFIFGLKNRVISISKMNTSYFLFFLIYIFTIVGIYPLKDPYFLMPIFFFLTISIFYFFKFQSNIFEGFFKKKYFAVVLLIHFGVSFYQIFLSTNLNQGLSQYHLLVKLDQIANVNPEALIADGTGALPQSKLVPQFFGLYDYEANRFATGKLIEEKPDLIFLTPKLQFADFRLQAFISDGYVPIAPFIVAKKVKVPSVLLFSSAELFKNLQSTFSFPINVISFRTEQSKDSNITVTAVCADTFNEQDSWIASDFVKCSRFFFKYLPERTTVYAVPWPYYEKNWNVSLVRQLNYKNN